MNIVCVCALHSVSTGPVVERLAEMPRERERHVRQNLFLLHPLSDGWTNAGALSPFGVVGTAAIRSIINDGTRHGL